MTVGTGEDGMVSVTVGAEPEENGVEVGPQQRTGSIVIEPDMGKQHGAG